MDQLDFEQAVQNNRDQHPPFPGKVYCCFILFIRIIKVFWEIETHQIAKAYSHITVA